MIPKTSRNLRYKNFTLGKCFKTETSLSVRFITKRKKPNYALRARRKVARFHRLAKERAKERFENWLCAFIAGYLFLVIYIYKHYYFYSDLLFYYINLVMFL